MQKNYRLKRGDLIVLEIKNPQTNEISKEKKEIVKELGTKTTHGFSALSVNEPLFKTLEMKIAESIIFGKEIHFKKKIIKIKEVKRS